MRPFIFIALALALLGTRAYADDRPNGSYVYDGGAVPLFWAPLVGGAILDTEIPARTTPLWFDAHDGGATPSTWEVPSWTLGVAGVGVAGAYVAASHDPMRWNHAKGLAEALATSSFIDSTLKPAFGRHRPDWSLAGTDPEKDDSFPSGHATRAFAIATYTALYLHDHVAGEHTIAYAGIFSGALLVDAERVAHNRHHLSDVAAGSLIGAVTSLLIYRYQDARTSGLPSPRARASTLSFSGTF